MARPTSRWFLVVLIFCTLLLIVWMSGPSRPTGTVMILDGVDCFPGDNYQTSRFRSDTECVSECHRLGLQVCVVCEGVVYYRRQTIGQCLWHLQPQAQSRVYLCWDRKLPYFYGINNRVRRYCQGILGPGGPYQLPDSYQSITTYLRENHRSEWLYRHHRNLQRFLDLSPERFAFQLNPYDLAWSLDTPTFTKSRWLTEPKRSVLLPLEHLYRPSHYTYILGQDRPYHDKLDSCVWRGVNSGDFYRNNDQRASRRDLVLLYRHRPEYNIGLSYHNTKPPAGQKFSFHGPDYVRGPLSIKEQLKYRYIINVEGNDFATSLNWVMLSNSVPLMPEPTVETWKLESRLVPYVHYVPLRRDFRDLDQQMAWCRSHQKQCQKIVIMSKLYVLQFFHRSKEQRIIQKIISTYRNHVKSSELADFETD